MSRHPLFAAVAVLILALPAAAMAQTPPAGGGNGGRRGGRGGNGALAATALTAADLSQAVNEMSLPAEEKDKGGGIVQDATAALRQGVQDLRDADPADRPQKVQDLQKAMADAKAKVLAELTPEQRAELAGKMAVLSVTHVSAALAAEKKTADGLGVPADQKTQADNVLDDATKTVDGYKADADGVKDDAAETALSQKVAKTLQETNRSLADILGQDDARQVNRAGLQAMRPAGGGRRRRGPATTRAAD